MIEGTNRGPEYPGNGPAAGNLQHRTSSIETPAKYR